MAPRTPKDYISPRRWLDEPGDDLSPSRPDRNKPRNKPADRFQHPSKEGHNDQFSTQPVNENDQFSTQPVNENDQFSTQPVNENDEVHQVRQRGVVQEPAQDSTSTDPTQSQAVIKNAEQQQQQSAQQQQQQSAQQQQQQSAQQQPDNFASAAAHPRDRKIMAAAVQGGAGSSATSSSDLVVRSRTWSEDITRNWNKPVSNSETIHERVERYQTYFQLDAGQLNHITERFCEEIDTGLRLHHADPTTQFPAERCSLKMLDTCVEAIPDGTERGVAYALDFGGTNLRAVRVKLDGNGHLSLSQVKKSLAKSGAGLRKGLLDKKATATQLFDAFADTTKELMTGHGDHTSKDWVNVGFTFSFPIEQKSLQAASLVQWTKEFETGRDTIDPVEGMDVGMLLERALWRREVPAKPAAVLNDTTGTLLSCAYEKPAGLPPCLIGMIIGTGVNGCYWSNDAKKFSYSGNLINTELGAFDKGLPLNDVDLQVDFASEANRGQQLFEKMVSGKYIGEVARRLIVKTYQTASPELSWVPDSLPSEACSMILNDATPSMTVVKQVLEGLWEWEDSSPDDQKLVKQLITMVFDRSAALCACVIAGMAKRTGSLSPAMGGLTVGIDGSLYTQNQWYAGRLRHYLDICLGETTSRLVHLSEASDGSGKGAAILAAVCGKTSK